MKFSEYLTNIREEKELSKREFANKLNVSPATIVRLESGITPKPSASFLKKLASFLDTTPTEILKDLSFYETSNNQNAAFVYGAYLFYDIWFVQNMYRYNDKIIFGCRAIKKRDKNNICLIDSFQSINHYDDPQQVLAQALFKILQIVDFNIKTYIIAFENSEEDAYKEYSKMKLNTKFTIKLALLNQDLSIKDEHIIKRD